MLYSVLSMAKPKMLVAVNVKITLEVYHPLIGPVPLKRILVDGALLIVIVNQSLKSTYH